MNVSWGNIFDLEDNVIAENVSGYEIPNKRLGTRCLTNYSDIRLVAREYSPIASLLSKIAIMTINGEFGISAWDKNDKLTNSVRKGWEKLFLQPNPFQTRSEFFTQLEIYTLLRGFCYVMPVYPFGYTDRPAELWIIPPQFLDVQPVRNHPMFNAAGNTKLRRLFFCYKGVRKELDESKLILFKDIGSLDINDDTLLPNPRITDLEYPIANGIGTQESMNALIVDRGASGIISNDMSDVHGDIDMDPNDKSDLEKTYKRKYGLTNDKISRIIVTAAKIKWQPMTMNVAELMLHEQHSSCIKDLCARYSFPDRLMQISEGATYNNQNEDKQSAYVDCILPNSIARMEQWNVGIKAIDNGIKITQTFGHIPILQRTELDRGRGLTAQNNGWRILWLEGTCTKNQWLEGIGHPKVDNELFNKFRYELTPEQLGIFEQPNRNANDNPASTVDQGTESDNPNDNGK